MFKKSLIAISLVLGAGSLASAAISRPLTTTMTCEQAADLVASRSAVILATGQFTFDRFVDGQGQCVNSEMAEPAWVPTSDSPQCFIGYTCQQDRRH